MRPYTLKYRLKVRENVLAILVSPNCFAQVLPTKSAETPNRRRLQATGLCLKLHRSRSFRCNHPLILLQQLTPLSLTTLTLMHRLLMMHLEAAALLSSVKKRRAAMPLPTVALPLAGLYLI